MIPTMTKELVDEIQSTCETFLFKNSSVEPLLAQLAQLIYVSDLLLDYPDLVREAGFIDNLIVAYEKKIHKIDPTYDF